MLSDALIKLERAKEDAEIKQKQQHQHYLQNTKEGSAQAPLLGITNMHKQNALHSSTSSSLSNAADKTQEGCHSPNCSTTCNSNEIFSNSSTSFYKTSGNSVHNHFKGRFFGPKSKFSQHNNCQNAASISVCLNNHHGLNKDISKTNTNSSIQDNKSSINTSNSTSETKTLAQNPIDFVASSKEKSNTSVKNKMEYNYLGVKRKAMKDRFLSVNPLTQQKSLPEATTAGNEQDKVVEQQTQRELSECDKLDQKSKALYITKLRQLGWVKGLDGTWQKDDNAEFDSDEEEPPSPKTVLNA